jgi:hypothetical protein
VLYVVHSPKRKTLNFLIFFFTQASQTAINQFLVSRIFRVKVALILMGSYFYIPSTINLINKNLHYREQKIPIL